MTTFHVAALSSAILLLIYAVYKALSRQDAATEARIKNLNAERKAQQIDEARRSIRGVVVGLFIVLVVAAGFWIWLGFPTSKQALGDAFMAQSGLGDLMRQKGEQGSR